MSKGFVKYERKGNNLYATHCKWERVDDRVQSNTIAYLGQVLDRELKIYKNRERGVFTYDKETGYGACDHYPLVSVKPYPSPVK